MIDTNKFRASIVLAGLSTKDFLEQTGIPQTRFYNVLKGKERSHFYVDELEKVKAVLHLNNDEFVSIFFGD